MSDENELSGDLLSGAAEIAKYLGMAERRVRYLDEAGLLPTFWIGKKMMARKSTLKAHVEKLESEARLRLRKLRKDCHLPIGSTSWSEWWQPKALPPLLAERQRLLPTPQKQRFLPAPQQDAAVRETSTVR